MEELGSEEADEMKANMGWDLGALSLSCALLPLSVANSGFLRSKACYSVQSFQISSPISVSGQPRGRKVVTFVGKSRDPNGEEKVSPFMGDDGVIQDMDGYLNYLCLEYDSVWDTKPSWCQPWTITVTGLLMIAVSWVVLHSVVISAVVASVISAWWYIFLYSYPESYKEMIAERRQRVRNGSEDTYGAKKNL